MTTAAMTTGSVVIIETAMGISSLFALTFKVKLFLIKSLHSITVSNTHVTSIFVSVAKTMKLCCRRRKEKKEAFSAKMFL